MLGALGKDDHQREIARRRSGRHGTPIDSCQKQNSKSGVAKQDRQIETFGFALSGFKPGLVRDFHCPISNVSGAISRLQRKYTLAQRTDVISFTSCKLIASTIGPSPLPRECCGPEHRTKLSYVGNQTI